MEWPCAHRIRVLDYHRPPDSNEVFWIIHGGFGRRHLVVFDGPQGFYEM